LGFIRSVPGLTLCMAAVAAAGSMAMPCQPEVCTSRPMAQTKPASSRATATTALVFITRRATRRLNFACKRNCAAQAMSVTALGS
jgi:hypothetical protein